MGALLHMQNDYAMEEFLELRHASMVEAAVACPSLVCWCNFQTRLLIRIAFQVAKYLITQFYSPNYTIRQRMDILEIFIETATV